MCIIVWKPKVKKFLFLEKKTENAMDNKLNNPADKEITESRVLHELNTEERYFNF